MRGTGEVLDVSQRVALGVAAESRAVDQADGHTRCRSIIPGPVAAFATAAKDVVRAGAALDVVSAVAAVDEIIAGAAEDRVASAEAEDVVVSAEAADRVVELGDAVVQVDGFGVVGSFYGGHGSSPRSGSYCPAKGRRSEYG